MKRTKNTPEKQPSHEHSRILATPPSALADSKGESWRRWNVLPNLVPMLELDPEKGIGKRIAYCRGQLDNLSVEALARYTKNFDSSGISRTTILRYESGDNIPGAREIRILCDALWVPAEWLLFGQVHFVEELPLGAQHLLKSIMSYIHERVGLPDFDVSKDMLTRQKAAETAQRQIWIDEARRPSSAK